MAEQEGAHQQADSKDKKTASQKMLEAEADALGKYYSLGKHYAPRLPKLQTILSDAENTCIAIGMAARIIAHPDLIKDEDVAKISNEQSANLAYVNALIQIPTGQKLVNEAMKNHLILCSTQDLGTLLGLYDGDSNATFEKIPDLDKEKLTANDLYTFYEELWHSHQTLEQKIMPTEKEYASYKYDIRDLTAWRIAIEADAKVNAALLIMEHSQANQDYIRKQILDNIKNEPDSKVFLAVNEAYQKHGLAALRQNPALLRPAFEAFFNDKARITSYADRAFEELKSQREEKPEEFRKVMAAKEPYFSMDKLNSVFGKKYGIEYHSREEFYASFAQDTDLGRWLRHEYEPVKPLPEPVMSDAERERLIKTLESSYKKLITQGVKTVRDFADQQVKDETYFSAHSDQIKGIPQEQENYKKITQSMTEIFKKLRENADDACIPVGAMTRIANTPQFIDEKTFKAMPTEMQTSLVLPATAMQIPMGRMLLDRAMKNGVNICSIDNNEAFGGAYYNQANALLLSNIDFDKTGVKPEDVLIMYEELWHSAQFEKPWNLDISDKDIRSGKFTARDHILGHMAAEAEAKVAAALMIMEHASQNKEADESRKELAEKLKPADGVGFDSSSDGGIYAAVNEAYEKHGLEGIKKNPALLAPAFEAFFKDKNNIEGYSIMFLREMEKMRLVNPKEYTEMTRTPGMHKTAEDFDRTFGRHFGDHGMLEGRYKNIDDIVGLMPEDSKLRKWLSKQIELPPAEIAAPLTPAPVPAVSPVRPN